LSDTEVKKQNRIFEFQRNGIHLVSLGVLVVNAFSNIREYYL